MVSTNNDETEESQKQLSPDIMKKLNDAFSSYLDGKGPDGDAAGLLDNDSLLELMQSSRMEEQSPGAELDSDDKQEIINVEDAIGNNSESSVIPEVEKEAVHNETSKINTKVVNTFSGVFDDVTYQSVEIEVSETENPAENENDFDYSDIVSDILKKTPKVSKVPKLSSYAKEKDESLNVSLQEKRKLSIKESDAHPELTKKETTSQSFISSQKEGSKAKESKSIKRPEPLQTQRVSTNQSSSHIPDSKTKSVSKAIDVNAINSPVNIALLYNRDHTLHDAASLSIDTHEKPERLIRAMWYLEKSRVFTDGTCTLIEEFGMAGQEDLLRVHEDSYISFVRSYADSGGGFLGDSTYLTPKTYDIARAAAGAAIRAGNMLVDREYSYAFVLARPPGHHASSEKYGGFCLFNNAAILAKYLQKCRNIGKILIIDWDAHAGDGTMEIFYEDPTVMFISLHRDPHGFYPRKGFSTQTGENAGRGYTLNVEMPEGAGNEEYMLAFDETVIPLVNHFSPEFIIFSCGFDAYYQEKNIGLTLDSDGYHQMTSKICSVFKGPIVFLMEGGYHDFNGQLCHSVLSSLHGKPNPVSDRQEISSYKQNLKKQVLADARKKIEESKKNNPVLSLQVS